MTATQVRADGEVLVNGEPAGFVEKRSDARWIAGPPWEAWLYGRGTKRNLKLGSFKTRREAVAEIGIEWEDWR